jgi:hypothetical protein
LRNKILEGLTEPKKTKTTHQHHHLFSIKKTIRRTYEV